MTVIRNLAADLSDFTWIYVPVFWIVVVGRMESIWAELALFAICYVGMASLYLAAKALWQMVVRADPGPADHH
jgi:hypothetical protein